MGSLADEVRYQQMMAINNNIATDGQVVAGGAPPQHIKQISSLDAVTQKPNKEFETDHLKIAQMLKDGYDCAAITTCTLCPFHEGDGACGLACESKKEPEVIQAKIDELSQPKGIKHDQGKPEVYYMFREFRHALLEVAKVATEGGKKYGKGNWRLIEQERWQNAMCRHILADGDINEEDFGLLHKAHVAFGALADLEKELTK